MNSLDNNEKIIHEALSQITVDTTNLKANIKAARNNMHQPTTRKPNKQRNIIAASLLCFLLLGSTVAAAKLGTFGWLMETFSPRYREVVEPVEAFSEDSDIRLEIIGAQKYENAAVVYLSIQDVSGQNRLTDKTDFSDTLKVATVSAKASSSAEENYSSFTVDKKLLFFDTEANKLYYELYITVDGGSLLADKLQIGAKVINFRYQAYKGEIPLQSLTLAKDTPLAIERKYIISQSWNKEKTADDFLALALGNSQKLSEDHEDIKISNIGIIDDKLHLQIVSPFQEEFGSKYHSFNFVDPQGNIIEEDYTFSFVGDRQGTLLSIGKDPLANAVNRYKEYVFSIDSEKIHSYTLRYSFDVISGTEGKWDVTADLTDSSRQIKRLTNFKAIDGHTFNTIFVTPLGLEVHGTYEGEECKAADMKLSIENSSGLINLPSGYGSSYNHSFHYYWKLSDPIRTDDVTAVMINGNRIPVK